MKAGVVTARMSVSSPLSGRSFTAIPRASRWASWPSGLPPPLENRISAGTGSPWKCGARESAAASGVAVNVPSHQTPLACRARLCGWTP